MGDLKSKIPDLQELVSMTNKLFKGIKNSVEEIIDDYKQKRAEPEKKDKPAPAAKAKPKTSAKSTRTTKSDDTGDK